MGRANINVVVRMRPCDEAMSTWELKPRQICDTTGKRPEFNFERVFPPDSTTQQLFDSVARPIVDDVMKGINGTIFAYGQTASGKTHTILGYGKEKGIIPLSIENIFTTIGSHPDQTFLLRVSYLEIYNEVLNDLLGSGGKSKKLGLNEVQGKFVVSNLEEVVVTSPSQCMSLIDKGNKNRSVGVSNLNQHSSRSHSIFRLVLESQDNTGGSVRVSELNLVDLAGSEKLVYEFGDKQQAETKNINKSLTFLKSVITQLSKGEQFIAYRQSCLTKLLKNSLGGNAKTALLCCASPADRHLQMTLSTLRFGSMAKKITNDARINETNDDNDVMLKKYVDQIDQLEAKLGDFAKVQLEKEQLQRNFENLQKDLETFRLRELERQTAREELEAMGGQLMNQKAAARSEEQEGRGSPQVSPEEMLAVNEMLQDMRQQNVNLALKLKAEEAMKEVVSQQQREELRELQARLEREKDEKERLSSRLQQQANHLESNEDRMKGLLKDLSDQLEYERADKQALSADLQERTQANLEQHKGTFQLELAEIQERLESERAQARDLQRRLGQQSAERHKKEGTMMVEVQKQRSLLEAEQLKNQNLQHERERQQSALDAQERRLRRQADAMQEAMAHAQAEAVNKEAQVKQQRADRNRDLAAQEAKNARMEQKFREMNEDMKVSGVDVDYHVAKTYDDYDRQVHILTKERDELLSVNAALQMDSQQKLDDYERRLKSPEKPPPASIDHDERLKEVRMLMAGSIKAAQDRVTQAQDRAMQAEQHCAGLQRQLDELQGELVLYKMQVDEMNKGPSRRSNNSVNNQNNSQQRPGQNPQYLEQADALDSFVRSRPNSARRRSGPPPDDDEFDIY